MLPTIFDELEAKGEVKGRVEGILHALKIRFQQPSASVSKKLSKITDLEQLTVLFERAMYCESLKEFSDSLK